MDFLKSALIIIGFIAFPFIAQAMHTDPFSALLILFFVFIGIVIVTVQVFEAIEERKKKKQHN